MENRIAADQANGPARNTRGSAPFVVDSEGPEFGSGAEETISGSFAPDDNLSVEPPFAIKKGYEVLEHLIGRFPLIGRRISAVTLHDTSQVSLLEHREMLSG